MQQLRKLTHILDLWIKVIRVTIEDLEFKIKILGNVSNKKSLQIFKPFLQISPSLNELFLLILRICKVYYMSISSRKL